MLTVAVLAIILIVALSACEVGGGGASDTKDKAANSVGGDAYALYTNAAEALQGADGYSMDMDIKMAMEIAGQSASTDITSNFAVNDPAGDIEMKSVQSMSLLGQDMVNTSYIKGGNLYSETLGQKMKMPMDAAMLKSQTSNVVLFPKDAIIDEKIDDADGGKKLSFTLKGEAMSDFVKKQMASVSEVEDLDISFGNAEISALVDGDGKMSECTMTVSLAMDMGVADMGTEAEETSTDAAAADAEKFSTEMTINMKNIKIGKTAIEFPTDLDTYTELDASALGTE
jgi:hypothetical protein